MPRFNRAEFVSCIERDLDVPEEAFIVAKQVASAYLALCKAKAPWVRPFNMLIPVEHQRVFKSFVAAANIVLEIRGSGQEVTAKDYVAAQFEGLSWTNKVPFPTQLATPAATVRYQDYAAKKEARQARVIRPEDNQQTEFEMENRKAERMAERWGVSVKRVLRTVPQEFTESYLRYKGVWESVQSTFFD